MGGHEKVEDADELVEEVEHLVDGVEEVEVSNILLPLTVRALCVNFKHKTLIFNTEKWVVF